MSDLGVAYAIAKRNKMAKYNMPKDLPEKDDAMEAADLDQMSVADLLNAADDEIDMTPERMKKIRIAKIMAVRR